MRSILLQMAKSTSPKGLQFADPDEQDTARSLVNDGLATGRGNSKYYVLKSLTPCGRHAARRLGLVWRLRAAALAVVLFAIGVIAWFGLNEKLGDALWQRLGL